MDTISWIVLLVIFFIVVCLVYRANRKLAKIEKEASKDSDDQFHFINEEEKKDKD